MSFRVAVVCEDHTNDQYVVRRVLQALLASKGKPHADVKVITNPRSTGVEMMSRLACEYLDRYGGRSDVVVFVVDADCRGDGPTGRGGRLTSLLRDCERHSDKALVVVARQEVEVWALWGIRSALGAQWDDVREERHPKERFFGPQLTDSDRRRPDGGRDRLITSALSSGFGSLASGCPELADLSDAFDAFT